MSPPVSSNSILLYDIPGNAAKDKSWSPNVWKIRYILNYKRIPYKTIWVEFHDIAQIAQEIGAPPTAFRRNGDPWYAVPILYDPSTSTYHSSSTKVARHLDIAYPDSPKLFPPGTEGLAAAFEDFWMDKVFPALFPLMLPRVCAQLNPSSQVWFRKSREAMYKKPLEELCPPARMPAQWKQLERALAQFAKYMAVSSAAGPFIAGECMTYPDVFMAGYFTWVKRLWGSESPEWKAMERWNDGRWSRLMTQFSKLEYTDEAPRAKM